MFEVEVVDLKLPVCSYVPMITILQIELSDLKSWRCLEYLDPRICLLLPHLKQIEEEK